jgi:hypothetical protein
VEWHFGVVGERDSGLAAPQRVAEGGTQMPGHDAVGRQAASGDLLVKAQDRVLAMGR